MKPLRGSTETFLSYVIKISALAIVYFIMARAALSISAVSGFAAVFWPSSGIALAAIFILGYRVWPGIFLGAFAANFVTGAQLPVAILIGIGNTLEALISFYLINRFVPNFRLSIDSIQDVIGLIGFAAIISPIFSATIGVSALWLDGVVSSITYRETWRAWYVGDALSNLKIAPLILVWFSAWPIKFKKERLLETVALLAFIFMTYYSIFETGSSNSYVIFLPLIWAALRFGMVGGVTATFIIAMLSMWGTFMGNGPFVGADISEGLLNLQRFMGTVSITVLILSASITQNKKSREEISALNKKLSKNLKDLQKLDRLKTEFLNIAAHELKTPLIPLIGYSQVLLKDNKIPKDANKKLQIVLRSARREQKLVDDVLDVARLEAGTMKFDIGEIRPIAMINKCANEILPRAKAKNLKIIVDMPATLPILKGDEWRLSQAIENILNNAVKFTDKGTVKITVKHQNNHIIFSFKDTGIGIARKNIPKLFTKFFQADTGAARKHEGTGLGLIIVRKIIEAHGGKVWVKSKLGKGSEFLFKLPLRK